MVRIRLGDLPEVRRRKRASAVPLSSFDRADRSLGGWKDDGTRSVTTVASDDRVKEITGSVFERCQAIVQISLVT
jgi:hypothetical protein